MATSENKVSELIKSWIPRRNDALNLSRDFWMPDQSCLVCYDCDTNFTVFNRRHHCRLCGRVFCSKCTANFISVPPDATLQEEWDKIRVCNYCFNQQTPQLLELGPVDDALSPSARSMNSSVTCDNSNSHNSNNSVASNSYATGPYQLVHYDSPTPEHELDDAISQRSTYPYGSLLDSPLDQFAFCVNRSDDDDDYGVYNSDSGARPQPEVNDYYGTNNIGLYVPQDGHTKEFSFSPPSIDIDDQGIENINKIEEEEDGDECEACPYDIEGNDVDEPVDFENNALLWLPPEPMDEEDDREATLLDDDEEEEGNSGDWGYLRSSNSFGSEEYYPKDKSSDDYRQTMKNVVEGHFRALVSQLLQVENLSLDDEDYKESWLDIITSLSWEAATFLKPDTSKGGGMDPGGYVKVKCIACGHRTESVVVKGVVCKKNVAHRRMASKINRSRFLILGGALEYQRVTNQLSSFDTLLHQETDHLRMAVSKIGAHNPNVLLVEKSVSRYAQEYLLEKGISLVLNIKRPLLERVARCTGAQIVPSVDHLTSPKLGNCDLFHVERFVEEHGSAGQGGKKLVKTLMFFDGCPKPLGCTILLKGGNGDDLKRLKHVVQYGVFAAYHLALETSFLADEGASLPELPLKSLTNVALPDIPSSIVRSISTIPCSTILDTRKPLGSESVIELQKSDKCERLYSGKSDLIDRNAGTWSTSSFKYLDTMSNKAVQSNLNPTKSFPFSLSTIDMLRKSSINEVSMENDKVAPINPCHNSTTKTIDGHVKIPFVGTLGKVEQGLGGSHAENNALASTNNGVGSSKEEFPPSPSDHQSILVSLSTRCVWKGTVCERANLLRIKYYGSFDKPLGRFLRDHLFDQSYCCRSCEMPSEAHVHSYTHRQGSLTISVKKLPDFFVPGEREGKIWMWHRCLRCPRINGFPPATHRVVMSDAAWGLSFGKFLELSFSNHAAASRVASCGHSLHRDCLRFYGFGTMVACFRYASIDVHSVYLPPSKLEFNYDNQEWIQKEADEVRNRTKVLFAEVENALHEISEKASNAWSQDGGIRAPDVRLHIAEQEMMLQKDKEEFEESLRLLLNNGGKVDRPRVDILEIYKLRRQILFHSYVWDLRLINAASLINKTLQDGLKTFIPEFQGYGSSAEKLLDLNSPSVPSNRFHSCDSYLQDAKPETNLTQDVILGSIGAKGVPKTVTDLNLNTWKDAEVCISSAVSENRKPEPQNSGNAIKRALSEGEFTGMPNLYDTLDAAWTGKSHSISLTAKENGHPLPVSRSMNFLGMVNPIKANPDLESCTLDQGRIEVDRPLVSVLPKHGMDTLENQRKMVTPFPYVYNSFKTSLGSQKLVTSDYNPVYVSSFRELERQSGARLLLPIGVYDTVVPVYDDEPTSIIAYALISTDFHVQMSESERPKDGLNSIGSMSFLDSLNLLSLNFIDGSSDTNRNVGSTNESIFPMSASWGSSVSDPLLDVKDLHARVTFTDDGPLGKMKYTVICYFAKRFEALRKACCPSELDYVQSLSRCKKWGAQGGKSNVFFAKTLDDRFIIKQVTKIELESFIKFGPDYFKYMSESISSKSPTCLAKILGIYQVTSKNLKGGKESKLDVLVMENILFRRNVTRLYDLKGSTRSRYNADTSGSNKVLLDQNLIEAMPTSPIFLGNKAKRLLERAVWNDTSFLASIDVMDYSLLVGLDEEKHELVLGTIDFMRQYTWDKHLETWVKTSGILGGAKNASPTVISPQQYKKRFRKAMTAYFLMVPDQWSPPTPLNGPIESDVAEEIDNSQGDLIQI